MYKKRNTRVRDGRAPARSRTRHSRARSVGGSVVCTPLALGVGQIVYKIKFRLLIEPFVCLFRLFRLKASLTPTIR